MLVVEKVLKGKWPKCSLKHLKYFYFTLRSGHQRILEFRDHVPQWTNKVRLIYCNKTRQSMEAYEFTCFCSGQHGH